MVECPECGSKGYKFFGYCPNCGERVQGFGEHWAAMIDEFSLRPAFAFHTRPLWQSVVVFGVIFAVGWVTFGYLWEEVYRTDIRATSAAARSVRIEATMMTGIVMGLVAGIATIRARGGAINGVFASIFAMFMPGLYQYQKYGITKFIAGVYFPEEIVGSRLHRLDKLIPILMASFPAVLTTILIWKAHEYWLKRNNENKEWRETYVGDVKD